MADGQNGMVFQHPRAGIAHHHEDLFAHIWLVSV
jgi:hypothetical protein